MEKYKAILIAEIENIAKMSGRLNRERYFTIIVACFLAQLLMIAFTMAIPFVGFIVMMASFVVFLWTFTATVRRLHDTNRSAWWMICILIPIISLVLPWIFTVLPGDAEINRYG